MDTAAAAPPALVGCAVNELAAQDLDGIPDSVLHEDVGRLLRQRQRLDAQIARRLARWNSTKLWKGRGYRSAGTCLADTANMSPDAANAELRVARAGAGLPVASRAWCRGELGTDAMGLLVAARGTGREALMARDEAQLVQHCVTLRYQPARDALTYWQHLADAEIRPDGAPPEPPVFLNAEPTFGGAVSVSGVLDPVGGEEFRDALRRFEHDEYLGDKSSGRERSVGERRAAALVAMARQACSAPAGSRRPEPLLCVVVGDVTMRTLCETLAGTVLHPVLLGRHLTEAQMQTFIYDEAGTPLSASPTRSVTGRLRRAIQARDRRCRAPGCDRPSTICDVDHQITVAEGGDGDPKNLRLLCTTHNRYADLRPATPDVLEAPDAPDAPDTDAADPAPVTVTELVVVPEAGDQRGPRPPPAWAFEWRGPPLRIELDRRRAASGPRAAARCGAARPFPPGRGVPR